MCKIQFQPKMQIFGIKIQILDTFEEEIFDNFLRIVAKKYKLVDQNHFVKKAIFELKYVF